MKNKYFPVLIITVGMALTHLFFTLLVYRSNMHLHQNVSQLLDAGYLAVPNAHILPCLQEVGTALKGAVFFTLTIGIVLPFLVFLAAWIWDRAYRRNRIFLILLSGFVILCMMFLNKNGFNPIVTLWFLTVYITIFKLTLYFLPNIETRLSSKQLLIHLAVIVILAVPWMTIPSGTNFFLFVRDHILLSNSFGKGISDFYYRYNLYPAETIKPIIRKQIKTYRIDGDLDKETLERFKKALIPYDCLPIDSTVDADFTVHAFENTLSFSVNGRTVLKADPGEFLANSGELLNLLSSRSNRNAFTRELLAFSLVYGLPVFFYACLFALFQLIFSRLPGRMSGFILSSTGCLLVGIGVLVLFKVAAATSVPTTQIQPALSSDNPDVRVAALRTIYKEGLNPSEYRPHASSNISSYLPERIWWATCLANSPEAEADTILLQLLDDPHPLVACKAYQSLGIKKHRPAVDVILEKIKSSRHWYVQWYAYQSLRFIGWKQKISI